MSEAPAAPPEAPASPPVPRRAGWPVRILRGLLAAGFGLLIVVLALIGWLGATQSGLARLVDLAAQLSGGVVGIERPEGYLLGQLKLGRNTLLGCINTFLDRILDFVVNLLVKRCIFGRRHI